MPFDDLLVQHGPRAVLAAWLLAVAGVGAWELLAPLRGLRGPLTRRWVSHVALMALNAFAARALFPMLGVGLAVALAERDAGLLRAADVPWAAAVALSLAAQDLRGYLWHRLLHASPLLWRFHRIHHDDSDLDLSTALRFHPVEALGATGLRLVVIGVLGAPVAAVFLYELLYVGSALVAHANARLPRRLERAARWVFVTPDLHRIHHSALRADADSNYANIFAVWDRLLGTFRPAADRDPAVLPVGDPESDAGSSDGLAALLLRPFLPAPARVPAASLRT